MDGGPTALGLAGGGVGAGGRCSPSLSPRTRWRYRDALVEAMIAGAGCAGPRRQARLHPSSTLAEDTDRQALETWLSQRRASRSVGAGGTAPPCTRSLSEVASAIRPLRERARREGIGRLRRSRSPTPPWRAPCPRRDARPGASDATPCRTRSRWQAKTDAEYRVESARAPVLSYAKTFLGVRLPDHPGCGRPRRAGGMGNRRRWCWRSMRPRRRRGDRARLSLIGVGAYRPWRTGPGSPAAELWVRAMALCWRQDRRAITGAALLPGGIHERRVVAQGLEYGIRVRPKPRAAGWVQNLAASPNAVQAETQDKFPNRAVVLILTDDRELSLCGSARVGLGAQPWRGPLSVAESAEERRPHRPHLAFRRDALNGLERTRSGPRRCAGGGPGREEPSTSAPPGVISAALYAAGFTDHEIGQAPKRVLAMPAQRVEAAAFAPSVILGEGFVRDVLGASEDALASDRFDTLAAAGFDRCETMAEAARRSSFAAAGQPRRIRCLPSGAAEIATAEARLQNGRRAGTGGLRHRLRCTGSRRRRPAARRRWPR